MDKKNDSLKNPKDHKKLKLGDEYEVIPPQAVAASEAVVRTWIHLGRPESPFTESGEKLMKVIIAVWEDTWPQQASEWHAMRKNYQDVEMDISEQVSKKTGRSLASYPYPLYTMMKKVFPKFDPGERKNAMKFVKKWPMFRMANKI